MRKQGFVDFLAEDEIGFGSTEFIVLRPKGEINTPFIAALSRDEVFRKHCVKITEDTQLLTERFNVICISDEAHRSQVNLDQKVKITENGVTRTYGFAKYLHDSLPNATYVGFTGTPIDATLDVFGPVVDAYTMTESVKDEITVRIVYEGRAAKVLLDNKKLEGIDAQPDPDHLPGQPQDCGEAKRAGGRLHRDQEADEPGPGSLQQGRPAKY